MMNMCFVLFCLFSFHFHAFRIASENVSQYRSNEILNETFDMKIVGVLFCGFFFAFEAIGGARVCEKMGVTSP